MTKLESFFNKHALLRTGQAKLYIDTQLIKEAQGNGVMSSHFHGKISIGKDGTLPGVVDEFYWFEKAMSYTDITDLSELCDIGGDYNIPMDKNAYTGRLPSQGNLNFFFSQCDCIFR